MGKRTSGMRGKSGHADRVWSSSDPISIALPRMFNSVYPISQAYMGTQLTSSGSLATFSGVNFSVSSLDLITSLANIFDEYMIVGVEYMTIPEITSLSSPSNDCATLCTVIDSDDSSALTSFQQALDYESQLTSSGLVGQYRKFVPRIAVAAYSGTFVSYTNMAPQWIDSVSTGVQHYGIKTAWQQTDQAYKHDVWIRLHTLWRNVR